MRVVPLLILVLALPLAAQHDISKVDPVAPDGAIATPIPDTRAMRKYDIPDLAEARQALGSLLLEGRLRKPLVDFITREREVVQRVSLFEGGLVVLDMTGATTIRKKLLIPDDAMERYLQAVNPDRLETVVAWTLVPPEADRRGLLRAYRADGTYVEREFHPGRILPKALGDQIMPLRDLLRAMSEDRTITSSVAGYMPKAGDELVADDQTTWKVVRVIEEGPGIVELRSLDNPSTIYVSRPDMHLYFIGRRGERSEPQ